MVVQCSKQNVDVVVNKIENFSSTPKKYWFILDKMKLQRDFIKVHSLDILENISTKEEKNIFRHKEQKKRTFIG
jgi:hypothetical protein